MFSVICVVLVIAGNVNSVKDLEQAILDFYGPPMPPRIMPDNHHPPHNKPLLQPDHHDLREDVEEIKMDIPQGVLDNIFGPPNPDAEPPVPHFYSAVMDHMQSTKLKEEKGLPNPDKKNIAEVQEAPVSQADIANLFGTPPPSPVPETPEATAATENSTATNKTGFNLDDRFLSESQLRAQWNSNREKGDKDIVNHVEESRAFLGSGPKSHKREELEPLGPEKDRALLEPAPFERRQETIPLDPKGLEPTSTDSKPIDPRHLEPIPKHVDPRYLETTFLNFKPLDSEHLEPKNQTSTRTSSPNASSKIIASDSLLLVLVYFCLESLVLI